jgi:hypothetical protein
VTPYAIEIVAYVANNCRTLGARGPGAFVAAPAALFGRLGCTRKSHSTRRCVPRPFKVLRRLPGGWGGDAPASLYECAEALAAAIDAELLSQGEAGWEI